MLTRVFAVTQFYHFAFVTVSLALLGFGASGSVLTAFPALGRGGPRRWAWLALGQSVGTIGGYAATNALPFDSFSIAWDTTQVLYLVMYYLVLAVPFFFGGAVVAVLLSGWDQASPLPSHRVYAANLVGSGAGCLLALGGISWFGGVGVIFAAALLAALAALSFLLAGARRSRPLAAAAVVVAALLAVGTVAPPRALELRLSPYKDLSAALRYPGSELLSTGWSASARVDHVRSEGIRSLAGLSFTFEGSPPPQDGLTFDGDDLSAVPLVGPGDATFVPYLLGSLPFALRPGGDALILEPRAGLDVLVATASGMRSVVAVEPNELAVEAVREAAGVYDDPRVTVVVEEPRAYVERSGVYFDVVDLALTAPYRPVTSGAYSLVEDYRLTVEAFQRYLTRLRPGGLLAAMRWVQAPPSEELRLVALAAEAVRDTGGDPARSVVALRSYATVLVVVAPDGFTAADLDAIRGFAAARRFDLMVAPGLRPEEANLFNVVPDDAYHRTATALVTADNPAPVYAAVTFDIAPPRDDHPFFGHFFTWSQAGEVWQTLGKTWQPFGGAGYFVLLALLVLAALAAALLIVAPLAALRRGSHVSDGRGGRRSWTVAYFGLLGIGFLFVEIPLVQRYILLVGRPTAALAVVLFSLLVTSGMGSLLSRRMPWRLGAGLLTAVIAVSPALVGLLTDVVLLAPLPVRMAAGAAALAPLGFLMGTMFPKGLAHLEERRPRLIPWAWGINGAMSVISAVAAALLALSAGFTLVVVLGAVCYGICTLLVPAGSG